MENKTLVFHNDIPLKRCKYNGLKSYFSVLIARTARIVFEIVLF